jgi:hypothetical protein
VAQVRARLMDRGGRVLASAATWLETRPFLELAWVPTALSGGRLRGTLFLRSRRDTPAEQVHLIARAGRPPQTVADKLATPNQTEALEVPLPAVLAPLAGGTLLVEATARGHRATLISQWHLCRVPKLVPPPRLDGDLAERARLEPLAILGTGKDFLALAPGAWKGPADCSARCWLGWDEQALYLAVDVTGDQQVQPYEAEEMWRGDSLQWAVDFGGRGRLCLAAGQARPCWEEYGLAVGPEGNTLGWQWLPASGKPLVHLAALRRAGHTCYEAAVPLRHMRRPSPAGGPPLPAPPQEPLLTGFALLVNDNAGEGRKGWLQLFDGIGLAKDARRFGLLHLVG